MHTKSHYIFIEISYSHHLPYIEFKGQITNQKHLMHSIGLRPSRMNLI